MLSEFSVTYFWVALGVNLDYCVFHLNYFIYGPELLYSCTQIISALFGCVIWVLSLANFIVNLINNFRLRNLGVVVAQFSYFDVS